MRFAAPGFADFWHADAIYNDEAQMTNGIDWDLMRVMRDDDVVKYWRALRTRAAADGRALYFNGSVNPYAELNCMESPQVCYNMKLMLIVK